MMTLLDLGKVEGNAPELVIAVTLGMLIHDGAGLLA
jgi:hypothetical protein